MSFRELLDICKLKHPYMDFDDIEDDYDLSLSKDKDKEFIGKLRTMVLKRKRSEPEQFVPVKKLKDLTVSPPVSISYDPQAKLADLQRDGIAVIPVNWMDGARRAKVRQDFERTVRSFPEFKQNADQFVLGGFSAFGNPASFHNLFVRSIRQYAMYELVPLFKALVDSQANPGEWRLEQVVDRMMWRPVGLSATAESWHRDEADLAKEDDMVFGGWWNFDDIDQGFSCIPGTHREVSGHKGFVTIKSKEEKLALTNDPRKRLVKIPPGHIMIFYENLLHEVLAKARKKGQPDQMRQFLGWRVTKDDTPLYPVGDLFERQGVMQLKSGQTPPMYAKLHWTNWKPKLEKFSTDNMVPRVLEAKTVKSKTSKDAGKVFNVVEREMRSLADYGFPLYPKYAPHEISMHVPRRAWEIKRGSDNQVMMVSL